MRTNSGTVLKIFSYKSIIIFICFPIYSLKKAKGIPKIRPNKKERMDIKIVTCIPPSIYSSSPNGDIQLHPNYVQRHLTFNSSTFPSAINSESAPFIFATRISASLFATQATGQYGLL